MSQVLCGVCPWISCCLPVMVTQFRYVLCTLNPWRCLLLHSCLVYDWTSLLCTFLSPDANGGHNRYVLVQYWFNGPEIEIKVKPHGNSTSSQPYFRTASSAHTQNKMIAARNTPNTAMHKAVQQQGGELMAIGLNKLPRNSQQIRNYRRSETKKDTDVLYSVMLQCKLSEGKSDSFVRDVKAAPDHYRFLTQTQQSIASFASAILHWCESDAVQIDLCAWNLL